MKVFYISDLHVPYHDQPTVDACLKAIKKERPDVLCIGGDFLDFFKVSRYDRKPKEGDDLYDEILLGRMILGQFRKAMGRGRIVYLEGNHEERYEAYLAKNAPELWSFAELRFENLMGLDGLNIEYYRSTEQFWVEDLLLRHGHETFGFSTVPGSCARKGINTYYAHYVQGHVHKANVIHVGNAYVDFVGVENPCMCELTPGFMKGAAMWQRGWTVLEKEDERWQVRQIVL